MRTRPVAPTLLALLLTAAPGAAQLTREPTAAAPEDPLAAFDFYVGRITVSDPALAPFPSEVLLTRGVGGRSLRFVGWWEREGQPSEFVDGLMAWDPIAQIIRICAIFYHDAYFTGEVHVLDPARSIVQRDWTGHYPDGRQVRYRETWTPVSEDEFEWRIERLVDGRWELHLAPGREEPAVHRVERG